MDSPLIPCAPLGLVEDDMADVARALDALDGSQDRLRSLCYRPLNMDDIDWYSAAFREIRMGLFAGQRSLARERERI